MAVAFAAPVAVFAFIAVYCVLLVARLAATPVAFVPIEVALLPILVVFPDMFPEFVAMSVSLELIHNNKSDDG